MKNYNLLFIYKNRVSSLTECGNGESGYFYIGSLTHLPRRLGVVALPIWSFDVVVYLLTLKLLTYPTQISILELIPISVYTYSGTPLGRIGINFGQYYRIINLLGMLKPT